MDEMQGEEVARGCLPLQVLSYADCDGLCVNWDNSSRFLQVSGLQIPNE